MRFPGVWEFVLLALAAYRLTRLVGWDEFPLVARIRARIIGEVWVSVHASRAVDRAFEEVANVGHGSPEVTGIGGGVGAVELGLPGKQPSTVASDVRPAYRRPRLAHLVHCPFCVGWWVSLAVYGGWLASPHWSLIGLAPFALSSAVGLVAKNLDR